MDGNAYIDIAEAASKLLRSKVASDPELRGFIKLLGQWLIDQASAAPASSEERELLHAATRLGESGSAATVMHTTVAAAQTRLSGSISQGPSTKAPTTQAPVQPISPSARSLPISSGVVPLRLGGSEIHHVPVTGTTADLGRARQSASVGPNQPAGSNEPTTFFDDSRAIDLHLVERRCKLKAESCRLVAQRQTLGTDVSQEPVITARISELLVQGKAMDGCFLWALYRERKPPAAPVLELIAGCYDALGAAACLLRQHDAGSLALTQQELHDAMQFLAEASSGLRLVIEERTWLTAPDADQNDVHVWLKRNTHLRRVYLDRYMRLEDPADPALAPTIVERAKALAAAALSRSGKSKYINSCIKRIGYHAAQLQDHSPDEANRDWTIISEEISKLESCGVPSSDVRISSALLPVLDCELPAGVSESLIETARQHARLRAQPAAETEAPTELDETTAAREYSARVSQVRAVLAGTRVVIVGGEERRDAADRLVAAFALSELHWIALREHASAAPMLAPIQRSDTALVLILVKLAGHQHVDEARLYAREVGKPHVLIKAGYNPEQIAAAIFEQVSEQLGLPLGAPPQTLG